MPDPGGSGTLRVAPTPAPSPHVLDAAGVGREVAVLVQRDRQDLRVVDEQPSVPLPWWTSQSTTATRPTPSSSRALPRPRWRELASRQKPRPRSRLGVVAGRAHQRVGVVDLAGHDGPIRRPRAAGGEQRDLPAARAEPGVLAGVAALGFRHRDQRLEVVRGVEAQCVLPRQRLGAISTSSPAGRCRAPGRGSGASPPGSRTPARERPTDRVPRRCDGRSSARRTRSPSAASPPSPSRHHPVPSLHPAPGSRRVNDG